MPFGHRLEAGDRVAFRIRPRIARRGEDDARRRLVGHGHVDLAEAMRAERFEEGERVGGDERKDDLRFGIAEPAVELDDLRPLVRHHQPDVEHATVRHPLVGHPREHGADDAFLDGAEHRRRHDGRGRVGPHPARVRPRVALADALVVLRRGEQDVIGPVGEDEDAGLLAAHELLHDDRRPGLAVGFVEQHLAERCTGRVGVLADVDALARREPVRLQHDGEGAGLDVGHGRVVVAGTERAGGGGRDAVALHEGLGEPLAAFELRRRRCRPDDREAGGFEPIHEPGHERRLRPDDGEVDGVVLREGEETVYVARVEGDVRGERGGAGVARRAGERGTTGAAGEGVAQRVLAAPAPDDEDVHGRGDGERASRKIGRRANATVRIDGSCTASTAYISAHSLPCSSPGRALPLYAVLPSPRAPAARCPVLPRPGRHYR